MTDIPPGTGANISSTRLPDPENKGEFFYMFEGFTLYSRAELDKLVRILHGKLFTEYT